MKTVIAIGNGESRKNIDLSSIKDITVGCNAVARDHTVDHLVCCDKKMVKETLAYDVKKIYTRIKLANRWGDDRVCNLPPLPYQGTQRPDQPIHWGSGPYAVVLATTLGDHIKMIGFDLYGTEDAKQNNIYKSTQNYKIADYRMTDPRYWIYQIGKIIEYNQDKTFSIYNKKDWKCPEEWLHKNVSINSLESF